MFLVLKITTATLLPMAAILTTDYYRY